MDRALFGESACLKRVLESSATNNNYQQLSLKICFYLTMSASDMPKSQDKSDTASDMPKPQDKSDTACNMPKRLKAMYF